MYVEEFGVRLPVTRSKDRKLLVKSFDAIEPLIQRYIDITLSKSRNPKRTFNKKKEVFSYEATQFNNIFTKISKQNSIFKIFDEFEEGENIDKYFFNDEYLSIWHGDDHDLKDFFNMLNEIYNEKRKGIPRLYYWLSKDGSAIEPKCSIENELLHSLFYMLYYRVFFALTFFRKLDELSASDNITISNIYQINQLKEENKNLKKSFDEYSKLKKNNNLFNQIPKITFYIETKNTVLEALMPFFKDNKRTEIDHFLYKNNKDINFVFYGKENQLLDVFYKLRKLKKMEKASSGDFAKWIAYHFLHIKNEKSKEECHFSESTSKRYLGSKKNDRGCEDPLVKINETGERLVLIKR